MHSPVSSMVPESRPLLPVVSVTHYKVGNDRSISVQEFLRGLKRDRKSLRARKRQRRSPPAQPRPPQQYPLGKTSAPMLSNDALMNDLPQGVPRGTHPNKDRNVESVLEGQSHPLTTEFPTVRRTYKGRSARSKGASMVAGPETPKKARRHAPVNELPLIGILEGVQVYEPAVCCNRVE